MDKLDLDKLDELESKAVPAPWSVEPGYVAMPSNPKDGWTDGFIVAIRNAYPALSKELRSLRSAALQLEEKGARPVDPIGEIICERDRQKRVEGWTEAHDDAHAPGEMALAASCYAKDWVFPERRNRLVVPPKLWPWNHEWWKPKSPRRDLVRAAALIVAELERMDRKVSASSRKAEEGKGAQP